MNLTPYLDDLAMRVDLLGEQELQKQWLQFLNGAHSQPVFSPRRRRAEPPKLPWPDISVNEAIADLDAMVLAQFRTCSQVLETGSGAILCVRSNYGTSIIPSLFGVELFFMDDKHNTLPTSWPIAGGRKAIRRLVDAGVPNLEQGLGALTLEAGQKFYDILGFYPELDSCVHLYHPDFQGPMDICEVIWGSDLFLDIVDEPDLVKEFLHVITETYLAFMQRWQSMVPAEQPWSVHWGMIHQGSIMLRDDSAMNFSPQMFAEFIEPYDRRLLAELGGGALHFCGRGDHYIHLAASMPGLTAVNLSQPEYNDMETIFAHTVDKGLHILGLPQQAADEALAAGRQLQGRVHAW